MKPIGDGLSTKQYCSLGWILRHYLSDPRCRFGPCYCRCVFEYRRGYVRTVSLIKLGEEVQGFYPYDNCSSICLAYKQLDHECIEGQKSRPKTCAPDGNN